MDASGNDPVARDLERGADTIEEGVSESQPLLDATTASSSSAPAALEASEQTGVLSVEGTVAGPGEGCTCANRATREKIEATPPKALLQSRPQYIDHLDGLRAIAFLGVLLFHFRYGCPGGYLGVDIFFVLSGYLMTRSIENSLIRGNFTYYAFLVRRFWRLYPASLCIVLGTLLCTYMMMSSELALMISKSAIAAVAGWSNMLFLSEQGYFGTDSALKPLLHTWSLSVEWQFYLFWPLLLSATFPLRKHMPLSWPVSILTVASLLYSFALAKKKPDNAFFLLAPRVYEFGVGALAFCGLPTIRNRVAANAAVVAAMTAIGLSFLFMRSSLGSPAVVALPSVLGATLVLLTAPSVECNRVLMNPVLRYIGKISYSAYLVHWPLFVFFNSLYEADAPPVYMHFIAMTLCFGLSALLYHCVERVFMRQRTKVHNVIGLVLLLSCAIAAVHGVRSHGWSFRTHSGRGGSTRVHAHKEYLDEYRNLFKASLRPIPNSKYSLEFGAMPLESAGNISQGAQFDAAVIGDSFAAPLAGAFDWIARHHNMSFIMTSRPSCAPLVDPVSTDPTIRDFPNPNNNPGAELCKGTTRPAMFALMKAVNAPIIFLAGNWRATNQMWAAKRALDNTDNAPRTTENATQFEQSIRRVLSLDKTVVVFGSAPGAHYNVRSCLASAGPLSWLKHCPAISRFKEPLAGKGKLRDNMGERAQLRSTLEDLLNGTLLQDARKSGRLLYIDPYQSFCNVESGDCANHLQGEPMYSDEFHLTRNASMLLKDDIYRVLRQSQARTRAGTAGRSSTSANASQNDADDSRSRRAV